MLRPIARDAIDRRRRFPRDIIEGGVRGDLTCLSAGKIAMPSVRCSLPAVSLYHAFWPIFFDVFRS